MLGSQQVIQYLGRQSVQRQFPNCVMPWGETKKTLLVFQLHPMQMCSKMQTLVSGTLTFHIIHIYLTCQLAVPFVLPHLFPSKTVRWWLDGEKKMISLVLTKEKISNLVTIMLFHFFFIRPRQKDAMTVWCSDLYIPQKKERNAVWNDMKVSKWWLFGQFADINSDINIETQNKKYEPWS